MVVGDHEIWRVECVPHPVVPLTLAHDERGALVVVEMPGGRSHSHISSLATRHGVRLEAWPGRARPSEAHRQLRAYLEGRHREFDLPLRPLGTDFQLRVWEALRQIPHGRTCSYGELAARLGRPGASRAVGAANGRNPLPIVIPCHRVVGADGSLTGFGGGIALKRWLLELEGSAPPTSRQLGLDLSDATL